MPSIQDHLFELDGDHFTILPLPTQISAKPDYLHVSQPTTGTPSTPSQQDQTFTLTDDSANVYQISPKVHVVGAQAQVGRQVNILVQQSGDGSEVTFILQAKQKNGGRDDLDSYGRDAWLSGPFSNLADIGETAPSWSQSQISVNVSRCPQPLPSEFANIQVPRLFRGFSDIPMSVRFCPLNPTTDGCPSLQEWDRLLIPLGDLVDRHTQTTDNQHGGVIKLVNRQVYRPGHNVLLHATPLVHITARPKSEESARQCIYQIAHLLCVNSYNTIQVELVHDFIVRFGTDSNSQGMMGNQIKNCTSMSSPMACKDKIAVIGGYLRLSGSQELYATCCQHSIFENDAVKFNPDGYPDRPVECPPGRLLEDAITFAERVVEQRKDTVEKYPNAFTAFDRIEKANEALSALKLGRGNKDFGYICGSSGIGTRSSSFREGDHNDGLPIASEIDWALIKVHDVARVKSPYNSIDAHLSHALFCITDMIIENNELEFASLSNYILEQKPKAVPLVAKFDMYQKDAYGSLHSYRVRISFQAQGLAYSVSQHNDDDKFGKPGDAGAWVLGTEGKVVGILFGGDRNANNPSCTYIMDIMEVLADIEATTGRKVTIAK